MKIWRTEFHNYLIEAFLDPTSLFGNLIFYTVIGLISAFTYGNDEENLTGVNDYFQMFKFVSFAQTAFGMVTNCSRLNQPREYLIKISTKRNLKLSDIIRNLFLITITGGFFRIFITFWYSLMVYPIVKMSKLINTNQ